MAEDWMAPGCRSEQIKYSVIQYVTGEWAIVETIIKPIAWFPDKARAIKICKMLPPCNAEREF